MVCCVRELASVAELAKHLKYALKNYGTADAPGRLLVSAGDGYDTEAARQRRREHAAGEEEEQEETTWTPLQHRPRASEDNLETACGEAQDTAPEPWRARGCPLPVCPRTMTYVHEYRDGRRIRWTYHGEDRGITRTDLTGATKAEETGAAEAEGATSPLNKGEYLTAGLPGAAPPDPQERTESPSPGEEVPPAPNAADP
jgi:YD repeat-containing protein